MKSIGLLALAASSTAWVLPDQQVFMNLPDGSKQTQEKEQHSYMQQFQDHVGSAMQAVADELEDAGEAISNFDADTAFAKVIEDMESVAYDHSKDKTVYQIIAESGYADKFVEFLDDFEDVRDMLNSSDADVTVFVPTDKAFEKIPHRGDDDDDKDKKKPPKWFMEAVLKSHIVRGSYSARDIFGVHTLPTLLDGDHLSEDGSKTPQRLAVKVGWRGIYLNNYNRVVHRDFKASNGIVHGVHGFNIPPPPLPAIITLIPTVFSTFELGMRKTGLGRQIVHQKHRGATVFAPVNGAWSKLGWKANAFLFSRWGRKYLGGLLAYHIVHNQTLYSDEFYGPSEEGSESQAIPKGRWHVDLPTLLADQHLSVDIGRYGRLIDMHVNHFSKVIYQDAIGHDGVIHLISNVLIPHHKKHGAPPEGEISVEELKERLEPFLNHADYDVDDSEEHHHHHHHHPSMPAWENLEL